MSFTTDPFQDVSVFLLEDFPTCYFLLAFRQVAGHLGYTIPLVHDFLFSLGRGLK